MSEPAASGRVPVRALVATALGDPAQRRLQLAWASINAGQYAFLVANAVVAYEVGGSAGAGLLGLVAFLAPTLVAPFVGIPAARWHPERVLAAVTGIRAAAVAATTVVVVLDGPLPVLLGAVALQGAAGAFTRPLHVGLLPALARDPSELVAAKVRRASPRGWARSPGRRSAGCSSGSPARAARTSRSC